MSLPIAALGLIKYIPDVIDIFSSKEKKGKKAIEVVTDIAKEVTGKPTVEEAEQVIASDPNKAYEFKMAVMDNETVLERLDELSRQRASNQYQVKNEQADKVADDIITKNLIIIFILAIINIISIGVMSYYKVNNPALVALITNPISLVIGQLLAERQTVVSFFFGSSLGSKIKDFIKAGDK